MTHIIRLNWSGKWNVKFQFPMTHMNPVSSFTKIVNIWCSLLIRQWKKKKPDLTFIIHYNIKKTLYVYVLHIQPFHYCHNRSTHIAIPIPPPTHKAATPLLAPVRFKPCNSVTRILHPDAPIGCPRARAPPLILTYQK